MNVSRKNAKTTFLKWDESHDIMKFRQIFIDDEKTDFGPHNEENEQTPRKITNILKRV